MTLQQLEYIIAVDHFRHFAKAADDCNVTQPTLSAMIQKLEEELEVKLFDRTRQPVVPTPIGASVIEQAKQVLQQTKQIKNIIAEEKQSLCGTFRLGILPSIAPYLLPRFFPQLAKRYPQLELRVIELKTEPLKEALTAGEIDAGIVADLDGMDQFTKTTLLYDRFFAYVSRDCPLFDHRMIRTSDLSNQTIWLLDEGHCFRDQMVRFCQLEAARASQQVYHLGSMETFMRMVESGRGITFIPELATLQLDEHQQELVRPFALPSPTRKLVLLTQPYSVRRTLEELLCKEIRASVPKEMLKLTATQQLV
jgi:LysR family hydrogen peroxide-inducible transcriptional activator